MMIRVFKCLLFRREPHTLQRRAFSLPAADLGRAPGAGAQGPRRPQTTLRAPLRSVCLSRGRRSDPPTHAHVRWLGAFRSLSQL